MCFSFRAGIITLCTRIVPHTTPPIDVNYFHSLEIILVGFYAGAGNCAFCRFSDPIVRTELDGFLAVRWAACDVRTLLVLVRISITPRGAIPVGMCRDWLVGMVLVERYGGIISDLYSIVF